MVAHLLAAIYELDHLVRFHQLGFVAVWPLLGWACVVGPSRMPVVGLLLVALFFNTFGVILDDAIHLHVDRKDPLRAHRWLVRGVLTPRQALIVALTQVPLLIAAHVTAGFSADTLPWILGAVLGQGIYDLYGKSCRVPPLMEAAEGGAAFLLVIYGAAVTTKALNSLVWQTAAGAGAFILLVNAFHGSLRDIDVEIGCNQRTTPIWLGCRGTDAGAVHISRSMSWYAGIWQASLIALSVLLSVQLAPTGRRLGPVIAVLVTSFANAVLFGLLHHVRKPAWDVVMRVHVAILIVPIMLAFVPLLGPRYSAVLFIVYFVPCVLTAVYWWRARAYGSIVQPLTLGS
jgi:4-hydroxybenzoate polyprenyltransferase